MEKSIYLEIFGYVLRYIMGFYGIHIWMLPKFWCYPKILQVIAGVVSGKKMKNPLNLGSPDFRKAPDGLCQPFFGSENWAIPQNDFVKTAS